jgi:hypothetical protein
MADRIDVFVSSTSRDLDAYRARLRELILSMYPIGVSDRCLEGDDL